MPRENREIRRLTRHYYICIHILKESVFFNFHLFCCMLMIDIRLLGMMRRWEKSNQGFVFSHRKGHLLVGQRDFASTWGHVQ